jgi:UDP-N-acetylglucosamine 1-carboxyvinyltransferase
MRAAELRGGAALVIAGLQADGESVIDGCSYIYRGYENICRDLRELGARIANV